MDYKQKVNKTLRELKSVAKKTFEVDIGRYTVKYDLTTHRTLGMISPQNNGSLVMRLNPLLLEEDAQLYIDEVLIHEYAHLIVEAQYPNDMNGSKRVLPHGREFKTVCRILGIDDGATTGAFRHSQALKKARGTKPTHYYKCKCVIPSELSLIQHNKVQRGRETYSCRTCGERLNYIKSV